MNDLRPATKLDKFMEILVTGNNSLKERLDAGIVVVETIHEQELSPDLRRDFRRLRQGIQSYKEGDASENSQTNLAVALLAFYKKCIVSWTV